jgi:chromosome segregation ATPase
VAKVEVLDRADKPAASAPPTLAAIEPQVQRKRDNDRRRILEEELTREEQSLTQVRDSITQEQQNPQLIAAVRVAQQTADPTPAQLSDFRANIDRASGRIRGLQATAADHEKNIEALKKELGALKP